MAKVLLVDDELTMVQMVGDILRAEGHEVIPCTTLTAAVDSLQTHHPELVLTDLYLDRHNPQGLELVRKARTLPQPPVTIVLTGYGSVDTAVEAMRHGAFDYLEKPFKMDELRLCIQRGLNHSAALSETTFLRREVKRQYRFSQIIGNAPPMQEVFRLIDRVANTDSTALVLGESGTGKELVARALHFSSRRQNGTFVPINCSALPEALLESELFGHRRGAFTGAIADKKGLFQEADGGTIFLDEVGAMSPLLQSRLLRVLQEKEVRRVGDNVPSFVDVRVIAAANEPLEQRIKEGTFREDLYYRLNVIQIQLPPLRERKDDIPLLVAHFLARRQRPGATPFQVTRPLMEFLLNWNWPGNVRELENAIERAAVLAESAILRLGDLPPSLLAKAGVHAAADPGNDIFPLPAIATGPAVPGAALANAPGTTTQNPDGKPGEPLKPLRVFLREQEQAYLARALESVNGDKEQAALLLGVSLATLYRKLAGEDRDG
jgi:DNA-binding NtrC family response regulator